MSAFLGIHDGHNASAALVRNGRLELALQEERLSRVKNQGDAPSGAVSIAWRMASGNVDKVALNGRYMNYGQWRPDTILADYEASSTLSSRCKQLLKTTPVDRAYQRWKTHLRARALSQIGIEPDETVTVEHHLAHAAAAYYTSPWGSARPNERALVFTCDGSGDRLSATVSIGQRGSLERIAETSEHDSIGRLYALVTRQMAMAPLEHEYKVMGLAPYGSGACVAKKLIDLFEFAPGGMTWKRKSGVPSMYSAYGLVRRLLSSERFDSAAAGVQQFIEHMLTEWVRNAIRETGIGRIACSGGVFMNVKANLALLESPEVEEMFVFPSCGDESNSIGAACLLAARAGETIEALGPIYFGRPITDAEAESALAAAGRRLKTSFKADIERTAAEALASGQIVARVSGAAEFGARALGNRSILAHAGSVELARALNQTIKRRDFWMPFAPSVLAERAQDYYDKPKPAASPYMMLAFRSKPERRAAFCAAQHPYDLSTRPHEVFESHNPGYHRLLKEFEARTGEGILLNTSFNLHGEPMVYSAADAVDVFLRSGLDRMALGNWWVEKSA